MGALRCEGRVVQGGRRVISAEAVLRDGGGKVMAHGTSTLLVLGAEG
jgi:acyl-coenzyme A thioesterase PaaI-like protein